MNLDLMMKAKKIKCVAFDVDGVMTDGSLTFLEDGRETKTFNAKDGLGVTMLNQTGFKTAIITARDNGTVRIRAKILEITKLYEGQKQKILAFADLLKEFNLDPSEVAYMGDDWPDIHVLKEAGLSACPSDAIPEVIEMCDFVSTKGGGKGAVREFCNFILKAHGIQFEDLTKSV